MRSELQNVIVAVGPPFFYFSDFISYRNECIAKTVQFLPGFTFSWFDHQRAGYWKRYGRRMEAIVHQAFSDILYLHTRFLEVPAVDYHFVCTASIHSGVQGGVVAFQPVLDVVCVQDGNFGGLGQPFGTHHGNIRVRDGKYACASPGGRRNRVDGIFPSRPYLWMSGKKG